MTNDSDLISKLPTPIALHYEVAVGEGFIQERLEALRITVDHTLRITCCIMLAAYAASEAKQLTKLNRIIADLNHPHFSNWIIATRKFAGSSFESNNSLLNEYAVRFRKAIQGIDSLKIDLGDDIWAILILRGVRKRKDGKLPILEYFNSWRNRKAHDAPTAPFTASEGQSHLLLHTLLACMPAFFERCADLWSYRLEVFPSDSDSAIHFTGPKPMEATYASSVASKDKDRLYLASSNDEAVSLHPIIRTETRSLLLLDGWFLCDRKASDQDEYLLYQGPTGLTRRYDDESISYIRNLFQEKEIRLTAAASPAKAEILEDILGPKVVTIIERHFSSQFVGRRFLPRKRICDPLWRFVSKALPRRQGNAVIIRGESGTGKSSILYFLVHKILTRRVRKAGVAKDIVLFLRCTGMNGNEGETLFSSIIDAFGVKLKEDNSKVSTAIDRFKKMLRHLDTEFDIEGPRRLILVIDAINEATNPEDTFSQMIALIGAISEFRYIRLLVSIRNEFLEHLQGRLSSKQLDPQVSIQSFLYVPEANEDAAIRSNAPAWTVPKFTAEESEALYGLYQKEYGVHLGNAGACCTMWKALPLQSRKLLDTPFRIDLWMKAFGGRYAARITMRFELFNEYLNVLRARLPNLVNKCIPQVMDYMIEKGKVSLSESDEKALADIMQDNPVQALYMEGILQRPYRHIAASNYTFYHQRFAEALMARRLWEKMIGNTEDIGKATDEITEARLKSWRPPPHSELLIGAIEIILEVLMRRNRYSDANRIMRRVDFQLSPQNSLFFSAGRISSSVKFRMLLRRHLTSARDVCENEYQIGLGKIRMGKSRAAIEVFSRIPKADLNTLEPSLQAAVQMYRGLAYCTVGKFKEAEIQLRGALRNAKGSQIEGNLHGNLAFTIMNAKKEEFLRSRRVGRIPLLDFFSPVRMEIEKKYKFAIEKAVKSGDARSTLFWSICKAYFRGICGHYDESIEVLETNLDLCNRKVRDAHCFLYVNFYLGEIYCLKENGTERGIEYLMAALNYAADIKDQENLRRIKQAIERVRVDSKSSLAQSVSPSSMA